MEIRGEPDASVDRPWPPEAIIVHCNISVAMHQSPAYLFSQCGQQQWRSVKPLTCFPPIPQIGLGADLRVRNPPPAKDRYDV